MLKNKIKLTVTMLLVLTFSLLIVPTLNADPPPLPGRAYNGSVDSGSLTFAGSVTNSSVEFGIYVGSAVMDSTEDCTPTTQYITMYIANSSQTGLYGYGSGVVTHDGWYGEGQLVTNFNFWQTSVNVNGTVYYTGNWIIYSHSGDAYSCLSDGSLSSGTFSGWGLPDGNVPATNFGFGHNFGGWLYIECENTPYEPPEP